MTRDTCRLPNCEREPASADTAIQYRKRQFCSPTCDVKYDHIKADARDAERLDANREHGPAPGRRP